MFTDGMENDLSKHVKELSKNYLSNKAIEAIAPLRSAKVTLFIMILYNSENSIHNLRPFCRPLFCHSSVVMYT